MKNVFIEYLRTKKIEGLKKTLGKVDFSGQSSVEEFKKNNEDNYKAIIINDNDEMITCSKLEVDNIEFFIPEFNPVHIYFSIALENNLNSELLKKQIKSEIQMITDSQYNNYGLFISYLKRSMSSIIFLFSSIEAYINQQIPESYEYKKVTSKQIEIKNKQQIERHCSFEDKVKIILPEIFNSKKFHIDYPSDYQILRNLKEVRNDLIHLKSDLDKYDNYYREAFNKVIGFKLNETFKSTMKYMNYYIPDFITEAANENPAK